MEGEATGHAHAVHDLGNVELYNHNGTMYMSVHAPSDLIHEEHKTITVDEGIWEIGRVIEVDPFNDEIRRVAD